MIFFFSKSLQLKKISEILDVFIFFLIKLFISSTLPAVMKLITQKLATYLLPFLP